MASTSYSHSAPTSSSSQWYSYSYDVFLSFRGEDTRKTFVDHLYTALTNRLIFTYKDDETLPRGDSIAPSLFKAIEGSQIAVIVFSEKYADSSWCLEELAHIMKCRVEKNLIVMPIFYGVVPSDVRKQEGDFGKGFSKQEGKNIGKVETWRRALVDACEIAGWESKNIANGHEARAIKEIVDRISEKLLSINPSVDEDLVGMGTRLQELEAQLKFGLHGARMIGIWGVGGSGKTTLASSLCREFSGYFQAHCIVQNIREKSSKHGLETIQEEIISRLSSTQIKLQSVDEGKYMIRRMLCRSNVLIILDDVDDIEQLDALAGSHNWFGSGSRIVITTRDEHLLLTHRVDHICPVRLLSDEEAFMLFNKRAYNEETPIEGYMTLASRVVSYAAGLPLALKVLGSFLYDKDEKEWISTLSRLKGNPEMKIIEKLKISYDGLKPLEKELFLDIACFFRRNNVDKAMDIFEACGYHPIIGMRVLRQKSLISIVRGEFDMHDLVQELGHYIVRGEYPNNPEKHSRVWKEKEINNLCYGDATMENNEIRAIKYFHPPLGHSLLFCKIVSTMKKLRWLDVILDYEDYKNAGGPDFLSNELQYIKWQYYPRSAFPTSFQPMNLVTLNLYGSLQKRLWKGYKHLPHLKVLQLQKMKNLVSTPNFEGLPSLQKLTLYTCEELKKIHSSLGNHSNLENISIVFCYKLKKFPTIIHMKKLKTLEIRHCWKIKDFPMIKSNMESLVTLSLTGMWIDVLLSSVVDRCTNLIVLNLTDCYIKNHESVNQYALRHLVELTVSNIKHYETPPNDHLCISGLIAKVACGGDRYTNPKDCIRLPLLFPSYLRKLDLRMCELKDGDILYEIGELSNLEELDLGENNFTRLPFSLMQLSRLKIFFLCYCPFLVELPELPSSIVIFNADHCNSLVTIGDFYRSCKCLCEVSLINTNIMIDGGDLLETMLRGNAIEFHYMLLHLKGIEVARTLTSLLVRGNRCTLTFPHNWYNDYYGFLMCAVMKREGSTIYQTISKMDAMSGMYYGNRMVWEDRDISGNEYTYVWYVSFSSLQHTTWWEETNHVVPISLDIELSKGDVLCVGATRISKKSRIGAATLATQEAYEYLSYIPKFKIFYDSSKVLEIALPLTLPEFDVSKIGSF